MKNFIAFFAGAIWCTALVSQLPNGGFENWESLESYDNPVVDPSDFVSANEQFYWSYGVTSVFEVAGETGSALHLETVEIEGEPSPSFAILGGTPDGDDLVFPGGFPFSDMAVTGIQADLRYSINALSPGYVVVQFKVDGVPVTGGPDDGGTFFYPIAGDQPVFTPSSFDFLPAITQTPDTCVIAFVSNDLINELPGYVGDFLEVDNLEFTGTAEVVPGGNFDTWESGASIEVPQDWNTLIFGPFNTVQKSADAFGGDWSCQLSTVDIGGEVQPGVVYQGSVDDFGIYATEEIPDDVLGIDFAYKYSGQPGDSAIFAVILSEDLENSEGNVAFIPMVYGSTDWTTTQLNWEWMLGDFNPQYYAILAASSNFDTDLLEGGSQFWLDDVDWYLNPEACAFDPQINEEAPILCPDEVFTLSTMECDSYTWYKQLIGIPDDPEVISGADGQTLDIDLANYAGFYVWVECTMDGCTEASDPVAIDGWAFAPPAIASDGISDVCFGDSTLIENAFGSYATYQWLDLGVEIEGANEAEYWVSESGDYTLTVTPMECPNFEMNSGVPVSVTVHDELIPVIELNTSIETASSYSTYQWYSPNVDTGTLVSETASVDYDNESIEGNSIQVVVTDEFGCMGTSAVITWLGIDKESMASFAIVPNPVENTSTLSFGGAIPERVEILDVAGKLLKVIVPTGSTINLDFSDFPSGSYMISAVSDGARFTQQILKI